jgi:DNA-binding SARP family transcriptional activator
MSRVSVRLLGRPHVLVDDIEAGAPKGAKVWALLAYLAAAEVARPRSELAELLFGEAADPLGALRWNLAALRRLIDRPDAVKGDAIRLDRCDLMIDTVLVDEGDVAAVLTGTGGRELLAGLSFADSPVFELWLSGERQRLSRRLSSRRRELALDALARGDHELAVQVANELVTTEPFDEGHHALLIRALVLSGEHDAAQRQFDRCASFLRAELNTEPGPAVFAAAHLAGHPVGAASQPSYDEICARLNVAWQSFLAGSIDYALDMGRSTVVLSDVSGDLILRITGRVYLAGMLNMAVRSWDEAATVTAEARHLAVEAGASAFEAIAFGILAGSELMRGDYPAALEYATSGLTRSDDTGALALNHAFLSAIAADTGQDERARAHAIEAMDQADRSADPIRLTYSYAYAAHVDLLAGRYDTARPHAERAVDACASILVMKPWPMAMLAELDVQAGDLDGAIATATQADGMATATGMSYQRALAQRVLALAEAARGDEPAAIDRLTLALGHARRTTGQGYAFHWPVAWVLESLVCLAARSQPDEAPRWAEALRDHASATGMLTFAARAERVLAASRLRATGREAMVDRAR